jgi:hypothetical protein
MPTLGELMEKFGSAAASQNNDAGDDHVPAVRQNPAVGPDGHHKIASGGDAMKSLTDIYLSLTQVDMNKEAAAAASAPADDDVDFAKMAEAMADAEATELVQQDQGDDDGSIMKVAQEYDSAGRIMARGFYDEFCKLAGALDTAVSENQMTESPSKASTPALGTRGLPTLETNFAGSDNHDQPMETAGSAAKQVYLDSLAPTKSISAGAGTGDDPEAAAISLGSGSPAGFATIKDLQV